MQAAVGWGVGVFWSRRCCHPGGGSHGRAGAQGQRFISRPRPRQGTAWVGAEQAAPARLGLAVLSACLPAARPMGAASSEPSGKPPPNPLNQHNRVGGGPPEESRRVAITSLWGCAYLAPPRSCCGPGSPPPPLPAPPHTGASAGPRWTHVTGRRQGPSVPRGHTDHKPSSRTPFRRHSETVPSPKAAPFTLRGPWQPAPAVWGELRPALSWPRH